MNLFFWQPPRTPDGIRRATQLHAKLSRRRPQLHYTVAGKQLILHDMKLGEGYPEEYLDKAAWFFAYHCALPLGLPEPTRFDSMNSHSNP